MACASFAKLNASSSQWIGQQSFTQSGPSSKAAARRFATPIRAGSYSDELVKTAKTIATPGRGILAIDESNATCGKRLASINLDNTEVNRQAYRQLLLDFQRARRSCRGEREANTRRRVKTFPLIWRAKLKFMSFGKPACTVAVLPGGSYRLSIIEGSKHCLYKGDIH